MPRIKKLFAVLGAVGVLFGLSASSALAFNSGTPPGPPDSSGGGGQGALVCHQTYPPRGGTTVSNRNGTDDHGPNAPGECGQE
jgi:hypothetical protein